MARECSALIRELRHNRRRKKRTGTPAATPFSVFFRFFNRHKSGRVGYLAWYSALAELKAATAELSVPVLAAAGGILLLGEPLTLRFLLASVAVLRGIALVVLEKSDRTLSR